LNFQGASIITVKGDKIRSDECYFDRKALENPKRESAEDQAGDVKIKIVPEGTFAGHIDKPELVKGGKVIPEDTGDQGGGQS
jgi:hypothetical protein